MGNVVLMQGKLLNRSAARLVGIVGSLGMMVYFGCLLVYGEARDSPQWLVWPAFAAMVVLIPLSWLLDWRAGKRGRATK